MTAETYASGAARSEDERSAPQASSSYRPDIDGLRAIAVAAVILFHARIPFLDGGFVGVDVFFAISGYLITNQIVTSLQRGGFSFWEFYTRRIRRLLPAAIATTAVTLLVGLFILQPYDQAESGKEAAFGLLSLSNVYFAREAGYWGAAAHTLPFLHTWSLSVEEQFYLVWPLALIVAVALFGRRWLPWVILLGVAGSLVVTTWLTSSQEQYAFYLMPARAYEFGIGALCVWAPKLVSKSSRNLATALWVCGLALIFFAVLTFNSTTVFPGYHAAIPTLGTAMVIWAARTDGWAGRALGNSVMTWLGLRSYSLYLVHWPILVLAELWLFELSQPLIIACLLLTLALAELQYRAVERPLRVHQVGAAESAHRTGARRFGRVAGPVLAAAAVLVVFSVTLSSWASQSDRYPPEVRPLLSLDEDSVNAARRADSNALCEEERSGNVCGVASSDSPNVLVLGDSLAPDGFNLMRTLFPEKNLLWAGMPGCPPLVDLNGVDFTFRDCEDFARGLFVELDSVLPEIDQVLIAVRLSDDRIGPVVETVEHLTERGVEVSVLGLGPRYPRLAWQLVASAGGRTSGGEELHRRLVNSAQDNEDYRERLQAVGGLYVDRWDLHCDGDYCLPSDPGAPLEELLIFDQVHLTVEGVEFLAPLLGRESFEATR